MTPPDVRRRILRTTLLLLLVMLSLALLPASARAGEVSDVVRVGWFDSPFNVADERGRRSGYSYDYQQQIAPYTSWTYEYVEGSWPELIQMLEEGKIDLLGDVSYTEERAERMLFSSLPMGAEEYYLFAAPGNSQISPEDYSTFNGKKIGVNKGSVQIDYYRDWAQANNVDAQIVELTGSEEENLKELAKGTIDLYLSLDGFFDKGAVVPVCRVGTSDIYFAVSKSRPELLVVLNNAMSRIQEKNQYYNQQLYAKYLQTSSVNNYLNASECEWIRDHGAIRVGYQDNYLAFCAKDLETEELTGALKDWFVAASSNLENAKVEFEPVCYPSSAAALDAMKRGEVDCVFPTNLTDYDGEVDGVFITPPLMHSDVLAVVRAQDQQEFANKERVKVALITDDPNYDTLLLDHFPTWRAIYYSDMAECLEAVSDGQADCVLISNYRYNNISSLCEKYGLTTLSTNVGLNHSLAVNRGDTVLYSILNKATAVVPSTTVSNALTRYYTEEAKSRVSDSVIQTILSILVSVLIVAVLVILFVLIRNAWSDRKGGKDRQAPLTRDRFDLFDTLAVPYGVYRITRAEHSATYDAQIVYVNAKYEELRGLPADAVIGHSVRELYPYIGEEWYEDAGRAALEGETVECEYTDRYSGQTFHLVLQQVVRPGYCAATYM